MDEDLSLKLLGNLPIEIIDVGKIHPPTLREIVDMGYSRYNCLLANLLVDKNNISNSDNLAEISNLTTYDIVNALCYNNPVFLFELLQVFELFFKEELLYCDKGFFYFGKLEDQRFIYKDNYELVKNIICEASCIKTKNNNVNPINEHAKKIADDLERARQKINKVKAKTGETLTLNDLISSFASFNKMDINTVFNYTMYQFDNQFKRMQLVNNYEISIQSLLHGADPKKVEIKDFIINLN